MTSAFSIVALDRMTAAVVLVVTSPLIAIAGILIRLSSPGPVIYRAERAGVDGEPFTMYKLRTMNIGAAAAGRITGGEDDRVFPFGKLLRRSKLDEIPQLVNVLRGDMALVGPRPEDVSIVHDHYVEPFLWESLSVPPGITSPGSLHYFSNESALPDDPHEAEALYLSELLPRKIAYDLVYVRSRSLRYHMEILVRTVLGIVGQGKRFERRLAWEAVEAEAILAARNEANTVEDS